MRNQWCDRKFRGQGLGQEHSQLLDKQHSTTPRALRHQHSWLFALAVRWPRADISAQLSKLMKLILIRLVTWHVVQSEYGANPSKYFLHNGCNLLHISANYLNLTIKWFYWIIWLTWSYIWHRIHGLICLPSSIATTTAWLHFCNWVSAAANSGSSMGRWTVAQSYWSRYLIWMVILPWTIDYVILIM